MNKYQLYTLGGALMAAVSLGACSSTGGFASKSAPVDYQVTLARTCTGIKGLDAVFKGVAGANPGLVDQKGQDVEAAAVKLIGAYCNSPTPPTDPAGAVAAIAVASVDLGDLVAQISK